MRLEGEQTAQQTAHTLAWQKEQTDRWYQEATSEKIKRKALEHRIAADARFFGLAGLKRNLIMKD